MTDGRLVELTSEESGSHTVSRRVQLGKGDGNRLRSAAEALACRFSDADWAVIDDLDRHVTFFSGGRVAVLFDESPRPLALRAIVSAYPDVDVTTVRIGEPSPMHVALAAY